MERDRDPQPAARRAAARVADSPEAVLATLTREGKRRWIYPTPSPGRFLRRRTVVAWALVVLYLALPLVQVGGRPAVLLDFIHREFALFGLVFYPTDTVLLLVLLVGVLLSVILLTALLGRVWCGWACPQTVYLEFVFRPIERLIEGREHVRKRRDDGPLTWDKAWRKGLKLSLYTAVSLFLAHTFVAYFVGWTALVDMITGPPTENGLFFVMMAITTGLVLFDFAYFREQMCTIACPYARMQSVLLDPESLIVAYDTSRGEPRGSRSRSALEREAATGSSALGDCIDCTACVRTCPTGIDIREGLQMECVACTQCIDACDVIMDRIDKPRGLIRYTSEREAEGLITRLVRPRTVIYGLLLALALAAFTTVLANREAYDVNVGRAVGEPFTVLPDGRIANRIRFRVRNQTGTDSAFTVSAVSDEDEDEDEAGLEIRAVGLMPVPLGSGEMERLETWVIADPDAFEHGVLEADFELAFEDGSSREVSFTLLGPKG
jgi:cytochrome c oxidase accessory protein FixG